MHGKDRSVEVKKDERERRGGANLPSLQKFLLRQGERKGEIERVIVEEREMKEKG